MPEKKKMFLVILEDDVSYNEQGAIEMAIRQLKGVKNTAPSDLEQARNEFKNKMFDALDVPADSPVRMYSI